MDTNLQSSSILATRNTPKAVALGTIDYYNTINSDSESSQYGADTEINTSIPAVLEIMDTVDKTYRVSPVALKRSPIMMCHIKQTAVPVVLDTGSENNVIGAVTCKRLGLKIMQTTSQAQQVDKSPLKAVGRVVTQLDNGDDSWVYDGLVCSGIGDIIIAGNPLLAQGINPVTYKNVIEIVKDNGQIKTLPYRPREPSICSKPMVFLLKVEQQVTVYPN